MKRHFFKIIFLVLFTVVQPVMAEPDIEAFKKNASVTYTENHTLDASPHIVRWLLENPLVVGHLWRIYGYAPKYQVHPASPPDVCQVTDPTGIRGNIQMLVHTDTRVVFFAKGVLTHWAIPIFNDGEGLFDITLKSRDVQTQLAISVYIHPKSKIAESALWILSPVLKSHIDNRITLNLQDLNHILKEMVASPQMVSQKLSGHDKTTFDAFFDVAPTK